MIPDEEHGIRVIAEAGIIACYLAIPAQNTCPETLLRYDAEVRDLWVGGKGITITRVVCNRNADIQRFII